MKIKLLFISIIIPTIVFGSIDHDSNSIYLYGSLDIAYSKLSSDAPNEPKDLNGFLYGTRLLGNYIFDRISLNGGIGYLDLNYESDVVNNQIVNIKTRTIFLEVNPQFRFTKRHSAGFLWQHIIGAKLLMGGPTNVSNSSDPDLTSSDLLGINYYYSIPWKSSRMRLGASLLKPVGIGNRSAYIAMFSVQLGLPILKNKRQGITERKRVKVSSFAFTLTNPQINFNTNSSKLSIGSVKYLTKLGKYLAKNNDMWTRLSIEGHTDSRGLASYNQGLSLERARSVAFILIKAGTKRFRISINGHGEGELIDKRDIPIAHKKNRRVEMHFVGKVNTRKMRMFFKKINN